MSRITPQTFNLQLERGERYDLLVEHGTGVFLLSGKVALHYGLLSLAEHTVAPKQILSSEQSLTIEYGGWVTFNAEECSELLIFTPQGIIAGMREHLGRWLRRCRRLNSSCFND